MVHRILPPDQLSSAPTTLVQASQSTGTGFQSPAAQNQAPTHQRGFPQPSQAPASRQFPSAIQRACCCYWKSTTITFPARRWPCVTSPIRLSAATGAERCLARWNPSERDAHCQGSDRQRVILIAARTAVCHKPVWLWYIAFWGCPKYTLVLRGLWCTTWLWPSLTAVCITSPCLSIRLSCPFSGSHALYDARSHANHDTVLETDEAHNRRHLPVTSWALRARTRRWESGSRGS